MIAVIALIRDLNLLRQRDLTNTPLGYCEESITANLCILLTQAIRLEKGHSMHRRELAFIKTLRRAEHVGAPLSEYMEDCV